MPGFVIPTGKYTFKGNLYWWYGNFALSQDGQTMKETGKKSAFGHPEDDVVWHRDK